MKFLKENSYDIVRLFINQIGITIFSVVIYLPAMVSIGDNAELKATATALISAFATLFYLILLYNAGWEFGSLDRMKSDSGKINLNRCKGMYMSLIANLPNFLLAGVATILMIVHMSTANASALTAFGVFSSLTRFLSSMYIGVLQYVFSFLSGDALPYMLWQTVGYIVLPLLSVATTHVGFVIGSHNFKISSVFGLGKGNKK